MRTLQLVLGVLLLFFSRDLMAAPPFEVVCHGHGLSAVNGMCYCEGLGDYVDPWRKNTAELCKITTRSRNECLDPKLPYPMRFIDRRCYCPATREFIGERVRFNRTKNSEVITIAKKNQALYPTEIPRCQSSYQNLNCPPATHIRGARSVRLEALLTHPLGTGIYQTVRLPGEDWDNSIDDSTLQGDPRENISILGPKLSQFFGFSESLDRVFMPRWDHLNAKIYQLNLSMEIFNPSDIYERYKIPFHFYPATGLVGVEDYLRKFAYEGGIPIAEVQPNGDENLLFHDTNYHTAKWIVLPNVLISLSQNQAKAIFELKKYFSEKAPEKVHLPQFKYYFYYFFTLKASQIDKASGTLLFYDRENQIHSTDIPLFPILEEAEENDLITQSALTLLGDSSSVREYITTSGRKLLYLLPEQEDKDLMNKLINEFDQKYRNDPAYTYSVSFIKVGTEPDPADFQIDYLASIIDRIKRLEVNVP